jgi:hypothetical protein
MTKRIERAAMIRMMATAAAIDAIQGALTASYVGILFAPLISIGAAFVFIRWFKEYGGEAPDPKKNPRLLMVLLEFVPALSAIPLWTVTTALSIAAHNRRARGL